MKYGAASDSVLPKSAVARASSACMTFITGSLVPLGAGLSAAADAALSLAADTSGNPTSCPASAQHAANRKTCFAPVFTLPRIRINPELFMECDLPTLAHLKPFMPQIRADKDCTSGSISKYA